MNCKNLVIFEKNIEFYIILFLNLRDKKSFLIKKYYMTKIY